MFGVLPAGCIAAEEALFEVNFKTAIELGTQKLPHLSIGLPIRILRTSHKHLHLHSDLLRNIPNLNPNIVKSGLPLLYSQLVGKYHYLIAIGRQPLDGRTHFVEKEHPVMGVFGEFCPTLSGDNGIVHVEGSDEAGVFEGGGGTDVAAVLLAP